jgi:hypothetical protein
MTELIAIPALSGSQNRAGHLSVTVHVRTRPNEMRGILGLSLASILANLTEGFLAGSRFVVVGLVRHLLT